MIVQPAQARRARSVANTRSVWHAARWGHIARLRVLSARADFDVEARDSERGWTALHWACKFDEHAAAVLLLDAGADPNARAMPPAEAPARPVLPKLTSRVQRRLLVRRQNDRRRRAAKRVASVLEAGGDDDTSRGDILKRELESERAARVNAKEIYGHLPNQYGAALDGSRNKIFGPHRSLADDSVMLPAAAADDTPLHVAAAFASPQLCGLLLGRGADHVATNAASATALDVAERMGRAPVATMMARWSRPGIHSDAEIGGPAGAIALRKGQWYRTGSERREAARPVETLRAMMHAAAEGKLSVGAGVDGGADVAAETLRKTLRAKRKALGVRIKAHAALDRDAVDGLLRSSGAGRYATGSGLGARAAIALASSGFNFDFDVVDPLEMLRYDAAGQGVAGTAGAGGAALEESGGDRDAGVAAAEAEAEAFLAGASSIPASMSAAATREAAAREAALNERYALERAIAELRTLVAMRGRAQGRAHPSLAKPLVELANALRELDVLLARATGAHNRDVLRSASPMSGTPIGALVDPREERAAAMKLIHATGGGEASTEAEMLLERAIELARAAIAPVEGGSAEGAEEGLEYRSVLHDDDELDFGVNPPTAAGRGSGSALARRRSARGARSGVGSTGTPSTAQAAAAHENTLLRALRALGSLLRSVGRDAAAVHVCEEVLDIEERRLRRAEGGEIVVLDPTKLATDPRLTRGLPDVETATSAAAKAGYAARNKRDSVLGTLKGTYRALRSVATAASELAAAIVDVWSQEQAGQRRSSLGAASRRSRSPGVRTSPGGRTSRRSSPGGASRRSRSPGWGGSRSAASPDGRGASGGGGGVEVEGLAGDTAQLERAAALLRRCVALLRRALGEQHMRVSEALERLAEVLMLLGGEARNQEAMALLAEAEVAGKGLLDDAQLAGLLERSSLALFNTVQLPAAENRMVRALRLRSSFAGRAHPSTRRCAANLALITSALRAEQLQTARRNAAEAKLKKRELYSYNTARIHDSPSGLHSKWELGTRY